MTTCPECGKAKWATVDSRADFRRKAMRCMECGFEVDARVFDEAERILQLDEGQDLQPDVPQKAEGG
jgi:transcription elongation factor Elf1